MRDEARFFGHVRTHLFGQHMTQSQVDGTHVLLSVWDARFPNKDTRWLAYALATAFHETAASMQPVEEYGHGLMHPYGQPDPVTSLRYYGRGYVQLTWKANYARMGLALGLDLVMHPDLALIPVTAAAILFGGMIDGKFTGATLGDYFNAGRDDPFDARRVINGTDRADMIANYHHVFLEALAAPA